MLQYAGFFQPDYVGQSQGDVYLSALLLVVLLFVLWVRRVSRTDTLRALVEVLESPKLKTTGLFDSQLEGQYRHHSVVLTCHDSTRGDPKRFSVCFRARSCISYRARLETTGDRIDKKLHFWRDIVTRDPALDSRYVFSSSEPKRFVSWVVGSNAVRDGLKALLEDRGVDVLSQQEDGLIATMYGDINDRTSPENLRGVLEAMNVLAQLGEAILARHTATPHRARPES